MNKFTKAGIAGAAALAIAAGGGTYALWSDYVVDGNNNVGADQLQITLAGSPSGGNAAQFDKMNFAPGEGFDQENVITGRIGGEDINVANAYVTFNMLDDAENGCGGTNAEAPVDPDCADADGEGEFSDNAKVTTINVTRTTGNCSNADGTTLNKVVQASDNYTLASIDDQKLLLGELGDGEKFCVKMVMALPGTAGNAVMTDTSSFELRYDLEQIPN